MKKRAVYILAGLALAGAIVLAGILLSPALRSGRALSFAEEPLSEGTAIEVQTTTRGFGVRKGDTFLYTIEVRYNPAQIAEIDKTDLDRNVNLSPFEVRGSREIDLIVDPTTRVYRREYTLQLINGKVDQRYDFPSIVVRYKLQGSAGFAEKTIVPAPVYVASRLPADVNGLELKPLKGAIIDRSQQYLPGILWAIGGLLGILGLADLIWRALPELRAAEARKSTSRSSDTIVQAYRSLHENIAAGVEPHRILRQIEYILRLVLVRREKAGWLEEPDLESISEGVRPQISALYARCQDSYGANNAGITEVQAALGQLDAVLAFYFGTEVETWQR